MTTRKTGPTLILALVIAGCATTTAVDNAADTARAATPKQTTGTEEGATTAKTSPDDAENPDKLICKRRARTGTRVTSKICGTREEWKAVEKEAQESTEELQRRPQQGRDAG